MTAKEATEAAVRDAVSRSVEDLRGVSASFDEFYYGLQKLGTVVVVGGAARDWSHGRSPRDLDLVVDIPSDELQDYMRTLTGRQNHFGGYEYWLNDCELPYMPSKIDIWAIRDTWAFKTYPNLFPEPTLKDIRRSVFFNLDAILVEPKPEGFLDIEGCIETLQSRVLDIVLEANPFPQFCVVKALVQARKYQLGLSERLVDYCKRQANDSLRWDTVAKTQTINWGVEVVTRQQASDLLGVDFRFTDEPKGTQLVDQSAISLGDH
jgi:hypothetical protein